MAAKKDVTKLDAKALVAAGVEKQGKGFELELTDNYSVKAKAHISADFIMNFGDINLKDTRQMFSLIEAVLEEGESEGFRQWVAESDIPMETVSDIFFLLFEGIMGKELKKP